MTKPEPKKRGPKPKPKVEEAAPVEVDVVVATADADEVIAAVDAALEAVAAPEPVEPEPVEPVAVEPQPEARSFPLIDGVDPKWAQHASIGARHIQFVAHPDVKHADLLGVLGANSVTIPGHAAPTLIASRTITPPKLHPVRVTFTVRERIEA